MAKNKKKKAQSPTVPLVAAGNPLDTPAYCARQKAFMDAVDCGNIERCRTMLEEGGIELINCDFSPFDCAMGTYDYGHLTLPFCMLFLSHLEKEGKSRFLNRHGMTPLIHALSRLYLFYEDMKKEAEGSAERAVAEETFKRQDEVCQLFFNHWPESAALAGMGNVTPLMYAAAAGSVEWCQRLLENPAVLLTLNDSSTEDSYFGIASALNLAIETGSTPLVKFFLSLLQIQLGIPKDVEDHYHPLMVSMSFSHLSAVQIILDKIITSFTFLSKEDFIHIAHTALRYVINLSLNDNFNNCQSKLRNMLACIERFMLNQYGFYSFLAEPLTEVERKFKEPALLDLLNFELYWHGCSKLRAMDRADRFFSEHTGALQELLVLCMEKSQCTLFPGEYFFFFHDLLSLVDEKILDELFRIPHHRAFVSLIKNYDITQYAHVLSSAKKLKFCTVDEHFISLKNFFALLQKAGILSHYELMSNPDDITACISFKEQDVLLQYNEQVLTFSILHIVEQLKKFLNTFAQFTIIANKEIESGEKAVLEFVFSFSVHLLHRAPPVENADAFFLQMLWESSAPFKAQLYEAVLNSLIAIVTKHQRFIKELSELNQNFLMLEREAQNSYADLLGSAYLTEEKKKIRQEMDALQKIFNQLKEEIDKATFPNVRYAQDSLAFFKKNPCSEVETDYLRKVKAAIVSYEEFEKFNQDLIVLTGKQAMRDIAKKTAEVKKKISQSLQLWQDKIKKKSAEQKKIEKDAKAKADSIALFLLQCNKAFPHFEINARCVGVDIIVLEANFDCKESSFVICYQGNNFSVTAQNYFSAVKIAMKDSVSACALGQEIIKTSEQENKLVFSFRYGNSSFKSVMLQENILQSLWLSSGASAVKEKEALLVYCQGLAVELAGTIQSVRGSLQDLLQMIETKQKALTSVRDEVLQQCPLIKKNYLEQFKLFNFSSVEMQVLSISKDGAFSEINFGCAKAWSDLMCRCEKLNGRLTEISLNRDDCDLEELAKVKQALYKCQSEISVLGADVESFRCNTVQKKIEQHTVWCDKYAAKLLSLNKTLEQEQSAEHAKQVELAAHTERKRIEKEQRKLTLAQESSGVPITDHALKKCSASSIFSKPGFTVLEFKEFKRLYDVVQASFTALCVAKKEHDNELLLEMHYHALSMQLVDLLEFIAASLRSSQAGDFATRIVHTFPLNISSPEYCDMFCDFIRQLLATLNPSSKEFALDFSFFSKQKFYQFSAMQKFDSEIIDFLDNYFQDLLCDLQKLERLLLLLPKEVQDGALPPDPDHIIYLSLHSVLRGTVEKYNVLSLKEGGRYAVAYDFMRNHWGVFKAIEAARELRNRYRHDGYAIRHNKARDDENTYIPGKHTCGVIKRLIQCILPEVQEFLLKGQDANISRLPLSPPLSPM